MLTGLRLAQLFEAEASDRDVALRRLATPVSKYWVCKRGPQHAYEALECLGGNGYTESFPLARRYREQPVMAIWEGSGNVIALDVLRALTRDRDSRRGVRRRARRAPRGASAVLDATSTARSGLLAAADGADPATAAVAGPPPQRGSRARVPGLAHAPPRARPRRRGLHRRTPRATIAARSTACCRGDGCRGHRRAPLIDRMFPDPLCGGHV